MFESICLMVQKSELYIKLMTFPNHDLAFHLVNSLVHPWNW